MAKGWEVAIRIQENFLGFGSTIGSLTREGFFLYVDSETVGKNPTFKERDEKLVPLRISPAETLSLEQYAPGGEITWQPRTDDSLPIWMAFFQGATHFSGGTSAASNTAGTWRFQAVPKTLAWTGKQYYGTGNQPTTGTSVYCFNLDKVFGAGMANAANGIRFERGIVSKLSFEQNPSSDLIAKAECRFLQHEDDGTYTTAFSSIPSAAGSLSAKKQLVDWNGTLTVGGQSYAIEKIALELDNNITERRKLGQKGFYQFPYGRAIFSGNFELELEDMTLFAEASAGGTLSARWNTSDGDWIQITCPNIVYKGNDVKVSGPGPVMIPVTFRAYPSASGRTDAVEFDVFYKETGTLPLAKYVIWN